MKLFIEWLIEPKEAYNGLIESSVAAVLAEEGIAQPVDLSVSIVDDDEIHRINKEQRGIDRPTDVLSFPMIDYTLYRSVEDAIVSEPSNPESGMVYLGDILLSWDKVIAQSKDYGHTLDRELSFLVVHSMLHLLGYDHMEEVEEALMISRQKMVMSKLGIQR